MIKKKLIKSELAQHLVYYAGFHILHFLVHIIILSVLSFFHFLLNHRLVDIQDWIFYHGWEVLVIGKVTAFLLIYRFTMVLSSQRNLFKSIMLNNKGSLRKEVPIGIIIFYVATFFLGAPKLRISPNINLFETSVSILGMGALYLTDLVLILSLNELIPISRKNWHREIVVFSILSYFIHKHIYLFGVNWSITFIFFNMLCLYLLRFRGEFRWLHSTLIVGFFIIPLYALFGLDPLLGGLYAPFEFTKRFGVLEIGALSATVFFYFRLKRYGSQL